MNEQLKEQLCYWAEMYHKKDFITKDPVQFPHRFSKERDVEVSALLTAFLSFGARPQILKTVNSLHDMIGFSPYEYILSKRWETFFSADDMRSFYRMVSYAKMHDFLSLLYRIYSEYNSFQQALVENSGENPFQKLCRLLNVSENSPQKKINMFLRWMVRRHSPVDFGIWTNFDAADLIMPLDTHVLRMSNQLKLLHSETFSLKNALSITRQLSDVFPSDPCLGDFALFGYGVEQRKLKKD